MKRTSQHILFVLGITVVLLTMIPFPALARQVWGFEHRSYFNPLVAGVREPHVSALALAWANRMDFMIREQDPRRVWDIDLGVELPIVGWERNRPAGTDRVSPGSWGLGLWIPIDFHMIEDFVDDSNPIINTDYRFGAMVKLQRGLEDRRWLGVRAFVGHESTHLGDEFSIRGEQTHPDTFERINVSWEFLDVSLLYEAMPGSVPWSVRGGVTLAVPFRSSYYQTDPESVTESAVGPVTGSVTWWDPYLGIELRWEEIVPPGRRVGWDAYGSGEVRWRSIYDYHKENPAASEARQLSVNLIAGIAQTGSDGLVGRVSPFVRFYHGVNPHGQFRNQKDFTQFGIGIRMLR